MRFNLLAQGGLLLLGLASAFPQQPQVFQGHELHLRQEEAAPAPPVADSGEPPQQGPEQVEQPEETEEEEECSLDTCGVDGCQGGGASPGLEDLLNAPINLPFPIPGVNAIAKRAVDSPSRGGLDQWVQRSWPSVVQLNIRGQGWWPGDDTRIERDFGDKPFKMGMKGLFGCTAIVVTSSESAYMSHHWERQVKIGEGDTNDGDMEDDFYKHVLYSLDGLTCKYNKEKDKEVKVAIYTKASIGSGPDNLRTPKAVDKIKAKLKRVIKGLKDKDITVVPYTAASQLADDESVAAGKLILSYDPKASADKAGYELWGAGLVDAVKYLTRPADEINEPIMKNEWKRGSDDDKGKDKDKKGGNGSRNRKRQNIPDKERFEQNLVSLASQGLCLNYLDNGAKRLGYETCLDFCEEQTGERGAMCPGPLEEDVPDKSLINKDPEGYRFTVMPCDCNLDDAKAIAEVFLGIVFEGLAQLGNIICAVFLEAVNTVLDIGLSAIPGAGPVYRAAKQGVQGAKTIAENGLGATEYKSWVGSACGVKDWNFDIMDAFVPMQDAPNEDFGGSLGCMRKGKDKSKCKAPNKGKKDDDDKKKKEEEEKKKKEEEEKKKKEEEEKKKKEEEEKKKKKNQCPATRKTKFAIQ